MEARRLRERARRGACALRSRHRRATAELPRQHSSPDDTHEHGAGEWRPEPLRNRRGSGIRRRHQKDDVLVTNFNNDGNLQGLGTTIVAFNPTTKKLTTFASLPRNLAGCPGGIGLTTAMTMLKTGWVIVGSAPSADGTTGTKGPGCLIVLDANGKVASIIANEGINMPWGNMATVDNGDTATIFVSNTGFGVGSPDGDPRVVNEETVLRINLAIKRRRAAVRGEPDCGRRRLRRAAKQGCVCHRTDGSRARRRRHALRL